MKKIISIVIIVAILSTLSTSFVCAQEQQSTAINIDLNNVVCNDYAGGGVQWDAHDWFDLSDEQWAEFTKRTDWLELGVIRCMLSTYWYCTAYDNNTPSYIWDAKTKIDEFGNIIDQKGNNITPNLRRMDRLYRVLDFCQAHNIDVMVGQWSYPNADGWIYTPADFLSEYNISLTDGRYAKIVSDLLLYLTKQKGYTCLKFLNIGNEINLNPSVWNFDDWSSFVKDLDIKLKQQGTDIKIVGPDSGYWNNLWFNETMEKLKNQVSVYDFHWYISKSNIKNRSAEDELRLIKNFSSINNPSSKVIYGEIGIQDGMGSDYQIGTREFWYSQAMARSIIQIMRAGSEAGIAWSIDDSVHINGPFPRDYKMTEASVTKLWGMWNTLGKEQGYPEDYNPKPWYYSWGLMSKYFKKGSKITAPELSLSNFDIVAGTSPNGEVSVAIVNDNPFAVDAKLNFNYLKDNDIKFEKYVLSKDSTQKGEMSEEVTINTALGKNIVVDADSFVLLTSKQKVDITPSDDYILQDNLSSVTNTFEHSDNLGFNGFEKHPNFKAVEYEVGKTPFLGDVTRIHRSTDRESAYLKYKYENLSSFRFTGYVSGDPNGCYKAYVSKDNKSYQYIRLKSILVNSLSNGMKSYIFEPEKTLTEKYNYLKIELMPRGHFNSTQLSFVQIGSKELPKLKPLKVDNLDITQLKGKETVLPSKVNVYYEGDISKNEGVVWQAGNDNKSHTGNVAGIPISANVRTIDEFNDTLLDTSKIFERLNVSIDQGNASVVYNDESRIVRSSEDMGYLTYNLQNMRNFESSFYLYDSKIVSKYITVKASVDNQNWVNVGLSVSPLSDKTNAWNKFLIKNRSPLPKGVKFLRFELTGGMTNWLQEVGEIKIYD